MDKKMKQFYQVPSIKVVSFKVEEGFTASKQNLNVGVMSSQTTDERPNVTEGTEGFFIRGI